MGQTRPLIVRYTRPALADLTSILDYISASSPKGARRIQQRIQIVIELASFHPDIGVQTDDAVIRRLGVPPYPYLVFYEAAATEIIIHAVRHTARDPSRRPGAD